MVGCLTLTKIESELFTVLKRKSLKPQIGGGACVRDQIVVHSLNNILCAVFRSTLAVMLLNVTWSEKYRTMQTSVRPSLQTSASLNVFGSVQKNIPQKH